MMGRGDEVIMTSASNPEVMAICYAQGWCASADKMTKTEAEAVTNIGTAFRSSNIVHFEEFECFTGVTSIPSLAFHSAQRLVSLNMPIGVVSIGDNAFNQCFLLNMVLPPNITSIGTSSFMNCRAFEKAVFIKPISAIHAMAFRNCHSLKLMEFHNDDAPTVGANAFENAGINATTRVIRVPRGATGYDTGEWLNLQTRATAPYTLEYIDE